jgi:cytochrome c5
MVSSSEDDEDHSSVIKTPGQLATAVVAAFVFPVAVFMLLGHFVTSERAIDPANPAYSDEAVSKRLKPVGELLLAGETSQVEPESSVAPGQPQVAAEASPTPAVESGEEKVKTIYTASCAACHASGAAGAPKLGDKAAWAPRIKGGNDGLYNSAINGKNAMPPKGGNASLSDADVKAVVDYMVSQSK